MAEGMINSRFEEIQAFSSGVKASGKINENARKILEIKKAWKNEYHSKTIENFINQYFDLIITVCDNAEESCPIFPQKVKKIHIGFKDPDGKDFKEFENLWIEMENRILPEIEKLL